MKRILSEVLDQVAPASLVDVFASYGLRFKQKATRAPVKNAPIVPQVGKGEAVVAGVIGFTGEIVRGTLLLATTFEVIADSRPSEPKGRALSKGSSSDWILVRDWTAELANQVLGRIKNRLHRFGVSFDVSPPASLSGPALTFAAPKGPSPRHHLFATGAGQEVWFCLDAHLDSKLEVSTDKGEPELPEGKVILFE